jgi:hypothetical protein
VNTDITDGDSNYDQAEFFEDNWKRNIEGLVKVYSYTSCEAKSGIMNPLVGNVVRATSEDAQEILRVLDMDVGDNLAMWVMENLTREEMIERVAQAAFNIGTRTGYGIGDLKERNYGFREDGSALIFDFNLMGDENATLDTYRAKVKSFANTKV